MQNNAVRSRTHSERDSLCRTCYWAHIQSGYAETEELVFCCFAALHRVPFKVSKCTDYSNKTLPKQPEMELITLAPAAATKTAADQLDTGKGNGDDTGTIGVAQTAADRLHVGGNSEEVLESWKAIATHFHRTVRTVQRWEELEGLPVYRHFHRQEATVYSYSSELDAWRQRRHRAPPRAMPKVAHSRMSLKGASVALSGANEVVCDLVPRRWIARRPTKRKISRR